MLRGAFYVLKTRKLSIDYCRVKNELIDLNQIIAEMHLRANSVEMKMFYLSITFYLFIENVYQTLKTFAF